VRSACFHVPAPRRYSVKNRYLVNVIGQLMFFFKNVIWRPCQLVLYGVGDRWTKEYEMLVQYCWQCETEILGEKSFPPTLCPPQIPHRMTWDWTRVERRVTKRLSHGLALLFRSDVTRSDTENTYKHTRANMELNNEFAVTHGAPPL
jgi:hypothetical protein